MPQKYSLSPLALTGLVASQLLVAHAAARPKAPAAPMSLRMDAKSKVRIVLPQNAQLPEQTAARELKDYLTRITGGTFTITKEGADARTPAIYVGATKFATQAGLKASALKSEEWRIRSRGNALILVGGGTRGTLYATYRFLEDNAGVHWWNPQEETVPTGKTLNLANLNRSGKPVFAYRDIYMLYGHDDGRFAARSRLNREGDAGYFAAREGKTAYGAAYGGTRDYGPPYHVHTFYMYISPEKYYKDHPDWFLIKGDGPPNEQNSQLHLTNPALRQEFLKLLRENIRKANQEAKEKGVPAPDVYSISQVDNIVGFAGPGDEELLKANDGAESAILLDFINFLADGIKDEFPGVYIDTLAYYSGEKVPKTIRPRDNVIIRLTDTKSNLIEPITAARNSEFRNNVENWAKITKNLRVWDYGLTFVYPGLPTPTIQTYPIDLRFLSQHNVEGVFIEHEIPILSDVRDLKVWLFAKLLEDPNRDFDALVRQFTDGFYGPAGKYVRTYLQELEKQATRPGAVADTGWMSSLQQHTYLTVDFVNRAEAILQQATDVVANDPVLSRRVRHARLPLDRAAVALDTTLMGQWVGTGHTPETMPLDRDAIAKRYLTTWNEQIDFRLPEAERDAERKAATAEVAKLTRGARYIPPPARFKDVPFGQLFVYDARRSRNYADAAKVVDDPEAESGMATRLEIPATELEKYKLPMPWGLYDYNKVIGLAQNIQPADVPGPGYHWYRLGVSPLPRSGYVYFFWSWNIQFDLDTGFDPNKPDQQFEIWANIKFEGPDFPHGKPTDKNAISVERLVLVRQ